MTDLELIAIGLTAAVLLCLALLAVFCGVAVYCFCRLWAMTTESRRSESEAWAEARKTIMDWYVAPTQAQPTRASGATRRAAKTDDEVMTEALHRMLGERSSGDGEILSQYGMGNPFLPGFDFAGAARNGSAK